VGARQRSARCWREIAQCWRELPKHSSRRPQHRPRPSNSPGLSNGHVHRSAPRSMPSCGKVEQRGQRELLCCSSRMADGYCSQLAAMALAIRRFGGPAREGAPMSRGSRLRRGREIGPRCRGPKSPANVELLQALKDRSGRPSGPSSLRCRLQ
jgi:hypothetical protein